MKQQETRTGPKEFKVRLHHADPGYCLEVWEMLRNGKNNVYIGRDDFGAHLWYTLRDAPDGFCERDYIINRSVEFIICTADWTPIGRDGNDRERFAEPYPTWAEACEKAWKRIRKEYPHVTLEGFDEWIESFAPQIMEAYEKRNWRNIYKKTVDRKILCRFNYLGEEMVITRLSRKHTKCKARWYEYFAQYPNIENTERYLKFYGYEY